jgi:hypothetical protein
VRFADAQVLPHETARVDFPGGGTLVGRVLDGEGRPVGPALVILSALRPGAVRFRVETTGDGRFRIDEVAGGRYRVHVHSLRDRFDVGAGQLDLDGGDHEVEVRLSVGEVSGRILPPSAAGGMPGSTGGTPDSAGDPGDRGFKFPLSLLEADAVHASVYRRVGGAFPDESGRYRLRGVPPGRYLLVVEASAYRRAAREIELRPGDRLRDVDFLLERRRAGTIRLVVRDRAGRPVEGLRVLGRTEGGSLRPLSADRPGPGAYVLRDVEAGPWRLALERRGFRDRRLRVTVEGGRTLEREIWMEGD